MRHTGTFKAHSVVIASVREPRENGTLRRSYASASGAWLAASPFRACSPFGLCFVAADGDPLVAARPWLTRDEGEGALSPNA